MVRCRKRRGPGGSRRSYRPAGCERQAGLPRAPSLELYVLPIGGGQHSLGEKHAAHWRRFGRGYGAEGSRTPDLCSAIAALSQLSYSPL